jgi:hypothetical protein
MADVTVKIRLTRSAEGPLTGNRQDPSGDYYQYVDPKALAEERDPRLKEFFAARLRGEPATLPRNKP